MSHCCSRRGTVPFVLSCKSLLVESILSKDSTLLGELCSYNVLGITVDEKKTRVPSNRYTCRSQVGVCLCPVNENGVPRKIGTVLPPCRGTRYTVSLLGQQNGVSFGSITPSNSIIN